MLTSRLFRCLLVLLVLADARLASGGAEDSSRRWMDVTGTFQVDATLVDYRDGKVTLRRMDGKTLVVSISRLSQADREYVESRVERPELPTDRRSGTLPLPDCPRCRGLGLVPLSDLPVYVHIGDPSTANPANAVGCRHCPHCLRGTDPEQLIGRERTRLRSAGRRHASWERKLQMPLLRIETHQLVVHSQAPLEEARRVATSIEALTRHLQQHTGSMMLTPRRPATDDFLVFADEASYERFLVFLEEEGRNSHVNWRVMRRRVGSTIGRLSFMYVPQNHTPVSNIATHTSAYSQILLATSDRASPWLREGFAAYCENAVTRRNLIHGIGTQSRNVDLSANWSIQLRRGIRPTELSPWSELLHRPLTSYRALHYLEAKSVVAFLLRNPQPFLDFIQLVSVGFSDEEALQQAYGKTITELDRQWRRWLGKETIDSPPSRRR